MKLLGYLAAVAFLVGTSQALNCYLCTSVTSSYGCGEYDFNPSVAYTQNDATTRGTQYENDFDCSVCAIYVAYLPSGTVVSRSCAVVTDGPCVPESSVGGKIKCCYTNFCNSFTSGSNFFETTTAYKPYGYQTTRPNGNNNGLGFYSGSPLQFSGVTSMALVVIMSLFSRLTTLFF